MYVFSVVMLKNRSFFGCVVKAFYHNLFLFDGGLIMCKKLTFLIVFVLMVLQTCNAVEIARWDFEETSGTTVTDQSGLYVATLGGSDTLDVDGKFGSGVDFAGDGGAIIDAASIEAFKFTGDFSISLWVRSDVEFGAHTRFIDISAADGGLQDSYRLFTHSGDNTDNFKFMSRQDGSNTQNIHTRDMPAGTWILLVLRHDLDGEVTMNVLLDGDSVDAAFVAANSVSWPTAGPIVYGEGELKLGRMNGTGRKFDGQMDALAFYDEVLTDDQVATLFYTSGSFGYPLASGPEPADGAMLSNTWVNLSWRPGDFATSHDVYVGDNFDDVNAGAESTFQGNQTDTFYVVGIPGFAYPDGLVPGTTYYWRIDEVNDVEPNSPWKGDIWSFSIPPKTAYLPDPAYGDEAVSVDVQLSWTGGFGSKLHTVYFGDNFDDVNNAGGGVQQGSETYTPGTLKMAKTYYWRVDEFDGVETHKGDVWSFTTEGAVSGPNPADGSVDVKPTVILSWDAGAVAGSHEVYFGTDADAVANATTTSPEYKGPKALGDESYDPGMLTLNTAYYWRIDEVNDVNPDSPWAGKVWSFSTGDFFVIDDFEIYDANDNQIWFVWHDGLGYGSPDLPPFYAGNGTGAAVGDENSPSYTEETIVHGGNQSMPIAYDNNKQGFSKYSEVELILTDQRDWTEEGVAELSIWFRGYPASVGSFVEEPVGTYTMTATGADIWNQADEFHFAYKMLTGAGTIVARVESVELTDNWAKAGVMIRETLDAGSKFAAVYIMPTSADGTATNGCRFQARSDTDASATSDTSVATAEQTAIVAPYWVKLERDVGGNFRGYYSANGTTWQLMSWNPQFIAMSSNVYVGLALTSHNNNATCEARFSNVTITGNVSGQWTNQDIGIASNDAEPLYVAVSNSTGAPAVVVHDDPAAATIDTWTEWVIPLQAFADQGIILTDVDRIAIGLGTQGNMTIPGGSGKMFIDDVRLYMPRESAEQ
jgi:hypothetical protein